MLQTKLVDLLGEIADLDIETRPAELEAHAYDALGAGRAASAPDAVTPAVVARPRTTGAVSALLRLAQETRTPVTVQGGATGLMGAARSLHDGIVLDMAAMAGVREIDAEAQAVWAEAGATIAQVNASLERHGLFVAHDPWTVSIATVGGTISTNGLGFLGGKYGSMGQQVLGVEAVLADGTVFQTPAVRPRSSGPDLTSLVIACEGQFAVITAAALRAFPLPEARLLAGFRFRSFAAGFGALLTMRRAGLTPAILDFGDRYPSSGGTGADATLYLGFDGCREEAEAAMGRARSACTGAGGTAVGDDEVTAFWDSRHEIAEGFARRRAAGERARGSAGGRSFDYVHVSLPASRVLTYRARALAIAQAAGVTVAETGLWATPELFSLVLAADAGPADDAVQRTAAVVDECLRLAQSSGGSMEYCHGAGVRLAHLMRAEHGAGLDVMRRMKQALDPAGVLNPGKLSLS
ncbi:MAG TPA: FAD-binding oxidoreductase [Dehalococcoidia bacterium]|nr:FAD-binding oxidoreductase [Dehalococcoidia bacterium]